MDSIKFPRQHKYGKRQRTKESIQRKYEIIDLDTESDTSTDSDESIEIECPVCARVANAVNRHPKQGKEPRVGTFGQFRDEIWCATCQEVVNYFDMRCRERQKRLLRHFDPVFLGFLSGSWFLKAGKGGVAEILSLVRVEHDELEEEEGIILDEEWINMERVKAWMLFCDTNHAGTCHTIQDAWHKIDPPPKLLLIDVERKCLVYKPGSCQYLALSYVWGRADKPFQTTRDNFSDLRRKGAFDTRYLRSRLPETIQDSIRLTRIMRQRYLWVDRFCIIQDDFIHKAEQLKSMASIYANAYFTILASDGNDDDYGLRGIGKGSAPRSCHLGDFDFGPKCRMTCKWPWLSEENKYDTRGWTFQEKILSRRQLIFNKNMVSWRCRKSSWAENIARPQVIAQGRGQDKEHLFSPWPSMSQYANLVREYNNRQLSHPEDALEAFSAITTIMSRSMIGGFLFGIPEAFFDGTLLWQPRDQLQRRVDANEIPLRNLPSWSWVGWTGDIDKRLWVDGHNYIATENDKPDSNDVPYLVIRPIVEWYKGRTDSGDRVRVQNSYYETSRAVKYRGKAHLENKYRRQMRLLDKILPRGWNFRHPVPVAARPLSPNEDAWSPVLEFRARRLHLVVGNALPDKGFLISCFSAELVDRDGSVVGALRLNLSNIEDVPTGQTCELIAIGKGEADWIANGHSVKQNFPESLSLHKNCPHLCEYGKCISEAGKIFKFYSVLWVEWEDGIAYRKALGRVFQTFWDSANTEEIDVHLG